MKYTIRFMGLKYPEAFTHENMEEEETKRYLFRAFPELTNLDWQVLEREGTITIECVDDTYTITMDRDE